MPKYDVVKPNAAKKRSLHGQSLVHCNQAITHVGEALSNESDAMNKAHLRRALEELRQVKEPAANDTKTRALRRV